MSLSLLRLRHLPSCVKRNEVVGCQMTAIPRCVFVVLGITAGWLMARHHLRVEFSWLVGCQIDSLPLLKLKLSLSSSISHVVQMPPCLCMCPERHAQSRASLMSLLRRAAFGLCSCWSTEQARAKLSSEDGHGTDASSAFSNLGVFSLFPLLLSV